MKVAAAMTEREKAIDALITAIARAAYERMRAAGPGNVPQQRTNPPVVPRSVTAA